MADPTITVRGRGDFSSLERDLNRSSGSLGRWAGRAARTVAVGTAVAAAGVAKLGLATIKAASESQQSLGATRTVYGRYASEVIKTSNRAAQAVGLSANEYRELANVTGAMLQSSGIPLRRTTQLTEQLNQRAADVAATFGGTAREAVESFSALLRGETDPVERYGVSIKESDISARLAAKGLDKLEGSALKQAQAQARLDLLFQQTAKSQGQFARESDTLAGQQQRFAAGVDNLSAKVGKMLLPAATRLVQYGNREVLPWINRTVKAFKDSDGDLGVFASKLGDDVGPELQRIVEAFQRAWPEIQRVRESLPSLTDVLSVTATGFEFAADNVDLLAKALPFLAAGFVAVKAAQAAGNLAAAARVPLMIAQVVATRQLAAATRELAAAQGAQARTSATSGAAAATATGKVSRLGVAARGAAGVAGLGALAAGASEADSGMGTLLTTLGGAATGFAIGGPVGAAVGALGGLAGSLLSTKGAAEQAQTSVGEYVDTLDRLSGAATTATRAQAYQNLVEKDQIGNIKALGLSTQTVVNSIVGRANASAKVEAALGRERAAIDTLKASLDQQVEAYRQSANASGMSDPATEARLERMRAEIERRRGVVAAIEGETDAVEKDTEAYRAFLAAVQGIPKRVSTRIDAMGGVESIRDVRELARSIRLTPKQLRTVIEAAGITPTKKQLASLMGELDKFPKKRPRTEVKVETKGAKAELSGFGSSLIRALGKAVNDAKRGGQQTKKAVEDGPKKAKADLSGFVASVRNGTGPAKAAGQSGGQQVGNALKSGVVAGFAGTQSALVSQAVAAVRAAVSAAKAAAKIKSPSRVMRDEVGVMLGRGLEDGLRSREGKVKDGGRKLIRSLLDGVEGGSDKIGSALDKLTKLIERQVKAKNSEKEERRERAILKALREKYSALRKNGREQDRVNEKLRTAREAYKGLVEQAKQYAATVKDSFVSFGNIVGLGVDEESSTTSSGGIIAQLRARVAQAEKFARTIQLLRSRQYGLNETSLQQLIDAGPEAALATAEAIAAGGTDAVAEINKLTDRLGRAGGQLGTDLSKQFHQAGIDSAAGVVKGLERQQAKLDATAKRFGRILADEARRRLLEDAQRGAREGERARRAAAGPDATRDEDKRRATSEQAQLDEMRRLREAVERLERTGPERTGAAAGEASGRGAMTALQGHARNRLQGGPL